MTKTTNMCEIQVLVFIFQVKIKRANAWTLRFKHWPKKERSKFLYFYINEHQKSWMFCWTLRNLLFLWSKFSYLTISKYWLKRRTFENLGFLKSKLSYLTTGKYRKDSARKSIDEYRKLGCLEISNFLLSKLSYLTIGKYQQDGYLY